MKKSGYKGLGGIDTIGLKENLERNGWHDDAIADIINAVVHHDELLRMLKVAQRRYRMMNVPCANIDNAIANAESK